MALNEITKGMSNAAEMINENFLAGSIIDSGTNSRGSFIKFGNGFCIQFVKYKHELKEQVIDYIVPLKDGLNASISTSTGEFNDAYNVENTTVYAYGGSFFRSVKGRNPWSGSASFPVIATIWGIYK